MKKIINLKQQELSSVSGGHCVCNERAVFDTEYHNECKTFCETFGGIRYFYGKPGNDPKKKAFPEEPIYVRTI